MAKYSTYGGSWVKATQANPVVPYNAPRDTEHLNPTENPEFESMQPTWQQDTAVPVLPITLVDADMPPLQASGGPIDGTPTSHQWGAGAGPGLSLEEAQVIRAEWNNRDLGAVAARLYTTPREVPGSYEPSDRLNPDADTASPETVEGRWHKGVGGVGDPDARRGFQRPRRARWFDRDLDFHRWDPEYGPKYYKNAKGQTVIDTTHVNQYTKPYARNAGETFMSPDQFVVPEQRRAPMNWQDAFVQDGTAVNTSFGLFSGGL